VRLSLLVLAVVLPAIAHAQPPAANTAPGGATCGTNGVNNSCTPRMLRSLISEARPGATITIASAIHGWPSTVTINKRVTISGGGVCASGCGTSPTPTYTKGATLITGPERAFVIDVASRGDGVVRITGIHFSGSPSFTYVFADSPTSGLFGATYFTNRADCRIDNNWFQSTNGNGGWYLNNKCLVDHNWGSVQGPQGHMFMVQRFGESGNGDEVWADPTLAPGSPDFTFFEDNTFTKADGAMGDQSCIDAYAGGNYVARHNYFDNCDLINHDKSGGGDTRSGRLFEVYRNRFDGTSNPFQAVFFLRDGNLYYWENTLIGTWQAHVKVWNQRIDSPQGNWLTCDGTRPWDANIGPRGYRCADQVGSGRAAGLGRRRVQPQERFPSRFWSNTGTVNSGCSGTSQQSGNVCNASPTSIISGTDYIFSTDASAAPSGYAPYAYPHPLTAK
jgi:hypothetical protein